MFELPIDKKQVKPNVFRKKCPARFLLWQVADKWSILVIDALCDKSMRNGELLRAIEGISQKMLTQTLRNLERINLVNRNDMQSVPPHVEYQLTELGLSLREKVCAMDRWIEENMLSIIPPEDIVYVK